MKRLLSTAAAAIFAACSTKVDLGDRLLGPPVTSVETTWVGNGPGGPRPEQWMLRVVSHLHALPDGTVLASGAETELKADLAGTRFIRDGRPVGALQDLGSAETGVAATGDAMYLYAAVVTARLGADGGTVAQGEPTLHCIRRYGHDGRPAPFAGGKGPDGSFLPVDKTSPITAVAAGGGELFVAHGASPATINVYTLPSLTPARAFSVPRASAIAIDSRGTVWIADEESGGSVGHYDRQGAELPGRITGLGRVVALASDSAGRLLVADGGASQQVVFFSDLGAQPRRAGTLGVAGGISASMGRAVGADRFLGLSAVAADDKGNVIVGMNLARTHLARVVAFEVSGESLWEIAALASEDTAVLDASDDDAQIYSRYARFTLEADRARWTGWTYDWLRFPDDPRGRTASAAAQLLQINGTRLLVDHQRNSLSMFRFTPHGASVVPAVTFAAYRLPGAMGPANWVWNDENGNGFREASEVQPLDGPEPATIWADESGTVWRASNDAGIDVFQPRNIGTQAAVHYASLPSSRRPLPPEVKKIGGLVVSNAENAAYVTAYTAETPNPFEGNEWSSIGTDLLRYNDWRGAPKLAWRARISSEGSERQVRGFAVAHDRVFVVFGNTGTIRVLDARSGRDVGRLRGAQELNGLSESRALMPITARRRRNGEYVLLVSDVFRSVNALVRIPPGWTDPGSF